MCDLLPLSAKQGQANREIPQFNLFWGYFRAPSAQFNFSPLTSQGMKSLDQGCTNQQSLRANPRVGENLPAAKVAYKKEGEKLLPRQGQGGMVLK